MYNINRTRLISTFTDLAAISSPSWKEKEVMEYIIKRFRKLKISSKKIPCRDSWNLLVTIPGTKEKTGTKPLLLSAHMDTVVPCDKVTPIVGEKRITSDGTSILGSDDKSAIAMFIEAIEFLKETKEEHGPIEILISCAEELGLLGIKEFDMAHLTSKRAFVFDSDGPVGKIVTKAPYHSSMEIFIEGKAAHAGMEPEKGVSAITVISTIIAALPSGRIDGETTLNVGVISGGRATNIVAPEAYCRLEVRSINNKKLREVEAQVRSITKETAQKFKAKARIERELEYPGFTLKETSPLIRHSAAAMRAIGIEPQFQASGGGSDTNIFNKAGIKAVNFSCGMQKVHTKEEFINIKDLVKGTELVLALIRGAG